ncbi:uncharacterized protein LOC109949576 [Prunus persica]|uniref:uncharacterized protein LOC109949576 n=1 Tax=Prunus persica TaxID=3760 RepID=UPI0009AB76BC|nr:uncharacterized protein LOC109949576 [Prunus persica]
MGEDDSSNPHGGSTTASSFPSQPTIAELSAQVAQLMQMQTQTSKLILNQDPTKTTPTSTQTTTPTSNQTTTLNPNQTTIPTTITYEASAAQIGIKLDGTNYALWSQSLIGNFIRFSTAKAVWDAVATTYYDGTDTSQVYDLKRRVSRMRQAGGSIETYYNTLQSLWREIDFRRPNMMEYESDIKRYNDILQEDRVYIFLDGLDDRLDKARSDVLHMTPFPTVDQAYAYVRREDVRQAVMMGSSDRATGAGLAAKNAPRSGPPTRAGQPHNSSTAAHLRSSHMLLLLDLRARKLRETASNSGHAALVSTEPPLALFPQVDPPDSPALPDVSGNCGYAFHTSAIRDTIGWIIDYGATDHMTFDPNDFLHTTTPRRTSIANANGVTCPVTGAGTVALSPSLSLSNTLLVPSLSNKLMSVSQDILTKLIIGRGTKRGGLYYVDDFSMGRANSMETQFNARIQILRSDNGGEFVNHDFQTYFQTHGIIHEITCPQTPQQNGVAERKNRYLLETARAFLIGGHVPRHH